MTLAYRTTEPGSATDARLHEDLLATWVAVTDAGGSVGSAAPGARPDRWFGAPR